MPQSIKIIGDINLPQFVKDIYSYGSNKISVEPWDWKKMATQLEPILKDCDDIEAERIRWLMATNAAKDKKKLKEESTFYRKVKRAARWLRKNDITCARDDKSEAIVILKKELYFNYIDEYIQTIGIVKMKEDPTERIVQKLDRILRSKKCPKFIKKTKVLSPKPLGCLLLLKLTKHL